MRHRNLVAPLGAALVIYGGSAGPAHAYLDPGTGSMILQALLGGVAGMALVGKLYWHRLLTLIGVRSPAPAEAPPARGEVSAKRTARTDT